MKNLIIVILLLVIGGGVYWYVKNDASISESQNENKTLNLSDSQSFQIINQPIANYSLDEGKFFVESSVKSGKVDLESSYREFGDKNDMNIGLQKSPVTLFENKGVRGVIYEILGSPVVSYKAEVQLDDNKYNEIVFYTASSKSITSKENIDKIINYLLDSIK